MMGILEVLGDSNNIFPTSACYDSHIITFHHSAIEAAPATKDGGTKIIMMGILEVLGDSNNIFPTSARYDSHISTFDNSAIEAAPALKMEAKRLLWWEY